MLSVFIAASGSSSGPDIFAEELTIGGVNKFFFYEFLNKYPELANVKMRHMADRWSNEPRKALQWGRRIECPAENCYSLISCNFDHDL